MARLKNREEMMDKGNGQGQRLIDMLRKNNKDLTLAARLRTEPDRFERYSRHEDGLLVDFSRTGIDDETFGLMLELAEVSGIAEQRARLYAGERINFTEHRAVLHPLWRERNFHELLDAAEAELLQNTLRRMQEIAGALHAGRLPSEQDAGRIRHVLHVGIGGSLLGPRLLCEAYPPAGKCPEIHFLSSVDALSRERLLARIDPEETAVILVSKSFTTSEVLLHANRIRDWQRSALGPQAADRRLFAVTASAERAEAFGVPEDQVLQMGEWTGGRFSVWSPVAPLPRQAAQGQSAGHPGHAVDLASQRLRPCRSRSDPLRQPPHQPACLAATAGDGVQRQIGRPGWKKGSPGDCAGRNG
jgi:glucose-6-phosphate isomerase